MRPHELGPSERGTLVDAGILAPSMHNTQPWRFRFRQRTVEVHRDPSRELGAEDPSGRMTLIGLGAVVLNLRVAAASLGWGARVALLPDPDRPNLVAEVTVGADLANGMDLAELHPFLARRRTNRQPFEERLIPPEVGRALERAAAAEGAGLNWVKEGYRTRMVLDLATDAEFADADDPARIVERGQWVGGERTRDGVPSASLGPRSAGSPSPVRDLAVDAEDRLRATAGFEDRPTLAVLSTSDDTPPDWLVAGQALQRVLLVATRYGLAASLLNQPIEHKNLHWLVRDPRTAWTASQVVLRLGYGPEVPPTPRRPVADYLLDDDGAPPGSDLSHESRR